MKRCPWSTSDSLLIKYHDEEWGVPIHDDNKLFEAIVLDAFQAGLSWRTILNKRENFRKCFNNFNPDKVSKFSEKEINKLMNDKSIIRNKQKILAAVNNAKCFTKIQKEYGSFDRYIWGFVNYKTINNKLKSHKNIPPKTPFSEEISKDLISRGFKFVGPTIIYAMMQAIGMVNDHITCCFRYKELHINIIKK